MRRALYPGSFDPLTNGHLDIIKRASLLFDELYIVVGLNSLKTAMFTPEERVSLIKESVKDLSNVKVFFINGLIVSFAKENDCNWIIKGLRNEEDFRYEKELEINNKYIHPEIETLYLSSSKDYEYLSSSTVKEYIKYKVDVSKLVPEPFYRVIKERFYNF